MPRQLLSQEIWYAERILRPVDLVGSKSLDPRHRPCIIVSKSVGCSSGRQTAEPHRSADPSAPDTEKGASPGPASQAPLASCRLWAGRLRLQKTRKPRCGEPRALEAMSQRGQRKGLSGTSNHTTTLSIASRRPDKQPIRAHDAGIALDPTARPQATPSLRLWLKADSVARKRKRQLGTSNRGNHGDYLRIKRNILVGEGSHYSLGLQEG